MKTLTLMDFEFQELIEVLEGAINTHEYIKATHMCEKLHHGYQAHMAHHLLGIVQLKAGPESASDSLS